MVVISSRRTTVSFDPDRANGASRTELRRKTWNATYHAGVADATSDGKIHSPSEPPRYEFPNAILPTDTKYKRLLKSTLSYVSYKIRAKEVAAK